MVRAWGLSFLLLVGVTWPLWQPDSDFLAVPLFSFGAAIPEWLQWGALGSAIAAAIFLCLAPAESMGRTGAIGAWSAAMLLLVAADQQRGQAWVWHGWLMAGIVVGATSDGIIPALRWLTAGIYFHSAISKLDASFLYSLGRDFVFVPLDAIGAARSDVPGWLLMAGALSFPIWELIVATLIVMPDRWRSVRWMALLGVVIMHACLLAILGPFGLQHQQGVLLWNLFFLVQGVILFTPLGELPGESETSAEPAEEVDPARDAPFRLQSLFVYASLGLGIGLPFLALGGLCDPWPAWELYAPRVARADLLIPRESVDKLPADLREIMLSQELADDVLLHRVPLDRWSLASRRAPLYPHPRVQLALALELLERYELGSVMRVQLAGPADRWTGKRSVEQFTSIEELRAATARYWLNARAKPLHP